MLMFRVKNFLQEELNDIIYKIIISIMNIIEIAITEVKMNYRTI